MSGKKKPARKIHRALPWPIASKTHGSAIACSGQQRQKGQSHGWPLEWFRFQFRSVRQKVIQFMQRTRRGRAFSENKAAVAQTFTGIGNSMPCAWMLDNGHGQTRNKTAAAARITSRTMWGGDDFVNFRGFRFPCLILKMQVELYDGIPV